MKKTSTLCLAALTAFSMSCSKPSETETPLPPANEPPFPEIIIDVSGPQRTDLTPVHQGNGESNFLGYGYDLTGKYADSASVKGMVVDVPAFSNDHPLRYENTVASLADYRTIDAQNAEELSGKLSNTLQVSAGSKLFKGSITAFFPEQTALSGKYIYGDYTEFIRYRQLKMMDETNLLQQYLSPAFTSDIQTLNSADLVKKYGTHVLSNIFLGAKLHAVYQAVSDAQDRRRSIQAGLTVAISKVFGLPSGFLDRVTAAEYSTISSAKIVYEVIGGDLSTIKENKTVNPTKVNSLNWRNSLDAAEGMFIGMAEDGLIPLYELIADPVKKAEAKEYIAGYLKEAEVKLKD